MGFEEKTTPILIALLVFSLFVLLALTSILPQGEWGSVDSRGMGLIEQSLNYEPWASPIWKPPSEEVESLLFALQAAIGSIIIGYYFGVLKGRKGSGKT